MTRAELDVCYAVVRAMNTIKQGVCKRIDVNEQIKVYECQGIIRIDIKKEV